MVSYLLILHIIFHSFLVQSLIVRILHKIMYFNRLANNHVHIGFVLSTSKLLSKPYPFQISDALFVSMFYVIYLHTSILSRAIQQMSRGVTIDELHKQHDSLADENNHLDENCMLLFFLTTIFVFFQ